MADFDEFLDIDNKETEESPPKEKPSSPASKPSEPTKDSLLGDFDALFEEAGSSPPPPSNPPPASSEVPPPSSGGVDDLFSDFLSEDTHPEAKAAPTPRSQPEPSPASVQPLPSTDQELEDLFSDVSEPSRDTQHEGEEKEKGDLDLSLGLDYVDRAPSGFKRKIVWISSVALVVLGLSAVGLAWFTKDGILGWKIGKRSTDEYQPPSAKILKKLNQSYELGCSFFSSDNIADFRKANAEFEGILKVDPRHHPTLARLVESILLSRSNVMDASSRRRVDELLGQSEKFYPGTLETLRARARYFLSAENFTEAENRVQKALSINPKDFDARILFAEISIAKQDWVTSSEKIDELLLENPEHRRAQYFQSRIFLQQGKLNEAIAKLQKLVSSDPVHVKSEIDLWQALYQKNGNFEEAQKGLREGITQKGDFLSSFDLGRAWRFLAEMSEKNNDLLGAIQAMEAGLEKDPISHSNSFYLGKLYLIQKDYARAAEQFNRAVSLAPNIFEYAVFQGESLREDGKPDESLSVLRKVIEQDPDNTKGHYELGLTQRKLSRMDEALASFEIVVKQDPQHLNGLINLGELYSDKDNFVMAKNLFDSALVLSPKSVRALVSLSQVLLATRKKKEALVRLKQAEKEEPVNVSVLAMLGKTYLALGNVDQAGQYFEKAVLLDPSRIDTQIAMGELQMGRKEWSRALETFKKILDSNPKNYEARVKEAEALIAQEMYEQAIVELQEASKYRPDYFPTKLNLAVAWRGAGDLEMATEFINSALTLRPESSEAFYQLELIHIYRNDVANAEKAMDQALKFDPTFTEPLISLGDFYMGRNLYSYATKYYERALAIDPKNSSLSLQVAESYRSEGNNRLAKTFYEKTLRINPKDSAAYVGLGLLFEEDQKTEQAIQFYRKAQSVDPKNPKPYYYLGFIYKNQNQRKNAIQAFEKYLALDPNSKERADIEDQIERLNSKF